jgi:hypothetical protein
MLFSLDGRSGQAPDAGIEGLDGGVAARASVAQKKRPTPRCGFDSNEWSDLTLRPRPSALRAWRRPRVRLAVERPDAVPCCKRERSDRL